MKTSKRDLDTRITSPVWGDWTDADRERYTDLLLKRYRGKNDEWHALFAILELDSSVGTRAEIGSPKLELLSKVAAAVTRLVDRARIAERLDEMRAEMRAERSEMLSLIAANAK